MKQYTVVCDWEGKEDEADADEIKVRAENEAEAIAKATKKWRLTIGAEWPHIRLTRAWVPTPADRLL